MTLERVDRPTAATSDRGHRRWPGRRRRTLAAWRQVWPRLGAVAIALVAWQAVVWSGWRPEYVLPGPWPVLVRLGDLATGGTLVDAVLITLRRAAVGYGIAVVVGLAVGAAVSQVPVLRRAVGSLVTGLQTMPSIAWFPLAVLLLGLTEGAITLVVALGAAPAVANGVVAGADHVPAQLTKAGRMLGARGLRLWWTVVLPASVPSLVVGLKQGWAFAWRSLMAGELLVVVAGQPSVGAQLQAARDLNDAVGLMAMMLVVLALGIAVDALVFGPVERTVARRWGLATVD